MYISFWYEWHFPNLFLVKSKALCHLKNIVRDGNHGPLHALQRLINAAAEFGGCMHPWGAGLPEIGKDSSMP